MTFLKIEKEIKCISIENENSELLFALQNSTEFGLVITTTSTEIYNLFKNKAKYINITEEDDKSMHYQMAMK